jgi:hypothetical protein
MSISPSPKKRVIKAVISSIKVTYDSKWKKYEWYCKASPGGNDRGNLYRIGFSKCLIASTMGVVLDHRPVLRGHIGDVVYVDLENRYLSKDGRYVYSEMSTLHMKKMQRDRLNGG